MDFRNFLENSFTFSPISTGTSCTTWTSHDFPSLMDPQLCSALGILSSGGTSTDFSSEGPIYKVTIERINNSVPYTFREKQAERIYRRLYQNKDYLPQFPVIIAKNKETFDSASELFSGSAETILEKLETLELLLRQLKDQRF